MSGTTSPTAAYVDATGIHAPTFADILSYLQTQYQAIYGADVYLGNDSQDGQLLAIFALAISDTNAACIAAYNNFSPATAQGAGLSSAVKINGLKREVPSNSQADLAIGGTVGTTIVNGVVADTQNQRWLLPASVTIPTAGTITVTATAAVAGALNAPAGTITRIATPTLGWQTVTNPYPATPGAPVESDAAMRLRQSVSTALPSRTVLDGIIGAVASLPGVTEYAGYENDTNSTDSNGLVAHSLAIVVQGGDDIEIAQTILEKKTPGAYTNGTTRETVNDYYGNPHDIGFYRPTQIEITVAIALKALTGYTSVIGDEIVQAVVAYINALAIGDDVYTTQLYPPAYLCNVPGVAPGDSQTYDITSIQICQTGGTLGTANVVIGFTETAFCQTSDVTLTVS
jgi:uncharacterized phage protein gp47/JayE